MATSPLVTGFLQNNLRLCLNCKDPSENDWQRKTPTSVHRSRLAGDFTTMENSLTLSQWCYGEQDYRISHEGVDVSIVAFLSLTKGESSPPSTIQKFEGNVLLILSCSIRMFTCIISCNKFSFKHEFINHYKLCCINEIKDNDKLLEEMPHI